MELLNYWPGYLKEILEFRQIASAEQPEFDRAWNDLEAAPNDFYISTLSEYGVSRWEAILGLTPAPSETLDERKFSVSARLSEQLPYTITKLRGQLESLCGADGYVLELRANEYELEIRVALERQHKYDDVAELLDRAVPANMVVILDLLYNQYQMFSGYTHTRLAAYTHAELRSEVIS